MISCIINPFVVYTNDEAGNASQIYARVNIQAIECLTIYILIMKVSIIIFFSGQNIDFESSRTTELNFLF